ncbi:MAG: ribonuclease HI [Flavobacteriaceae bacterium]|nr:ribonuclease HI [Flavobacteriaceae bacterium]
MGEIKKHIALYTDGAARGNPGPAGYGIILEWIGTNYIKEFSEGFECSTNNRMELLAVIDGLSKINTPNCIISVYSDSKYVTDAINKGWVYQWKAKGFKNRVNADLWKRFLSEIKKHQIEFIWIKGHNQHPQNERCDLLAVQASFKENKEIDKGYIQTK